MPQPTNCTSFHEKKKHYYFIWEAFLTVQIVCIRSLTHFLPLPGVYDIDSDWIQLPPASKINQTMNTWWTGGKLGQSYVPACCESFLTTPAISRAELSKPRPTHPVWASSIFHKRVLPDNGSIWIWEENRCILHMQNLSLQHPLWKWRPIVPNTLHAGSSLAISMLCVEKHDSGSGQP